MSNRTKYFIIGAVVVLALLIFDFFRSGRAPSAPPPVGNTENSPSTISTPGKVESQIPYSPKKVDLGNVSSQETPASLPSFNFLSDAFLPLTASQIQTMATALNFGAVSEKRANYGGGNTYLYEDRLGRVLAVVDAPPTLDYSQLPPEGAGGVTQLNRASSLALNLVNKVQPNLPAGWQWGISRALYLKGSESSATVVADPAQADVTQVTLSYLYGGYKVVNPKGQSEFAKFTFGAGEKILSAKIEFLVNNPGLKVSSSGNVTVKSLVEVNAAFVSGEAKAVSLSLSGVVSDEPIITPPSVVRAQDLKSVLVLGDGKLIPYYFISTSGSLSSGRTSEVDYLVPAGK